MKRERAEVVDIKRSHKRPNHDEDHREEHAFKSIFRSNRSKSLSERLYEMLDQLSRYLHDSHLKQIEQNSLVEIRELFMLAVEGMSLEDMHNLQYSNRLCYMLEVIEQKKLKQKNWSILRTIIEGQITRVQSLYMSYFDSFEYLTDLKVKYSHPFSEMS